MAQRPTIVIGIGEAGTKIASTLYDDLEEIYEEKNESITDEFTFVGIDSREEDLQDFARRGFQTIELDPHPNVFKAIKSERDYLTRGHEVEKAGGATRQRAVSRYFIDNERNYDYFYSRLKSVFETFDENTTIDGEMNVWVVNSLGGGTGSGAFPLVATIISEAIAEELNDRSLWIGGIGSLPRLDRLDAVPVPPEGDATLYANAYTALRELSVLLGYDFSDKYEDAAGRDFSFTLSIESDPDLFTEGDGFELKEPPFDFYTLMGIEEGKSDASLKNRNRIASDTILFFANIKGPEDFKNDVYDDPPEVLFSSVTGGHASVPVDEIRPYLELKDKLSELSEKLTEKRKEINRHRINRDILREISQYEPGEEPTVDPPVDTTIIDPDSGNSGSFSEKVELGHREEKQESGDDQSRDENQGEQMRRSFGMNVINAWNQIKDAHELASRIAGNFDEYTQEILDEAVQDNLLDNAAPFTSDLHVDYETVYKYFYFQELLEDYRVQRSNNTFRDDIADEWEDRKEDIEENLDELEDVEVHDVNRLTDADNLSQHEVALRRWEDVLSDYYGFRIERVEDDIENCTFLLDRGKKKRLKKKKKEIENKQQNLRNDYIGFSVLDEAVRDLENRRKKVSRKLDEKQTEIDAKLRDELLNQYEELQEDRDLKTTSKKQKEEQLREPGESRFASFKMKEFSEFTPELLRDHKSIMELVESEVVSKFQIINTINHINENELEEPMEDRKEIVEVQSRKMYDGSLAAEEDKKILQGELQAQQESVNLNAQSGKTVSIPTRFRIRLIRLFFEVYMENSSEFGTMHDLYTDDEPATTNFEAEQSDDEFITQAFAYPELFPDDERISDHFDTEYKNLSPK